MNRRDFLLKVTALCATIAVPMAEWLHQVEDGGIVRALTGKIYPGPVRRLDKESVSRQGMWGG
jgi:hypothetical protein